MKNIINITTYSEDLNRYIDKKDLETFINEHGQALRTQIDALNKRG